LDIVTIGPYSLIQSLDSVPVDPFHELWSDLTKSPFGPLLQVLQRLEFFTSEFRFQVAEEKEVARTEIRAVGRLRDMTESAAFERTFGRD
jgi:hypothetical protein